MIDRLRTHIPLSPFMFPLVMEDLNQIVGKVIKEVLLQTLWKPYLFRNFYLIEKPYNVSFRVLKCLS